MSVIDTTDAVERFRGLVKLEAGLHEQGIRTKEPERRVGVLVETAVAVLAALDAAEAAVARARAVPLASREPNYAGEYADGYDDGVGAVLAALDGGAA